MPGSRRSEKPLRSSVGNAAARLGAVNRPGPWREQGSHAKRLWGAGRSDLEGSWQTAGARSLPVAARGRVAPEQGAEVLVGRDLKPMRRAGPGWS